MNKLKAKVVDIKEKENLHIVKFDSNGVLLTMMSLELPKKVDIGANVILGFKPSHLCLAKNFSGLVSFSNKIAAKVVKIEKGELVSVVELSTDCGKMESLVTSDLALALNDEVTAFLGASELYIAKVEDGD